MGAAPNAGEKVLVKFALKPGAHRLLFTPLYMALAPVGIKNAFVAECARYLDPAMGGKFARADAHEGNKRGYIGLKSEERGESNPKKERQLERQAQRQRRRTGPASVADQGDANEDNSTDPAGGDFSLMMKAPSSKLLFQLFVHEIVEVARRKV